VKGDLRVFAPAFTNHDRLNRLRKKSFPLSSRA
jgi:hypothetical protein